MCRGSTNGEDVYLVRVDHIPLNQRSKLARLSWIEHHGGIPVDKCIGPEIQRLIDAGVVTKGCCCGHGKGPAVALALAESASLLRGLGYEPRLYKFNGLVEFELKTGAEVVSA